MIINIILFAIVLFLLIRNFKFGVFFIVATSVWLCMWRTPFMGSIYHIPAFIALMYAAFKYGTGFIKSYPFRFVMFIPFISIIATNAIKGFDVYPIIKLTVEYCLPALFFYLLSNENDIKLFLKILSVFLILLVGYTFFEEATASNPIMKWCTSHPDNFYWIADTDEFRYGFKRAQSFLLFCSALGGICNFTFFLIAYLKIRHSDLVQNKVYNFLLITLPVCSLLTGTRSVFLPLFIILLSFMKDYIKKHTVTFFALGLLVVMYATPYLGNIYESIVDSDNSTEVRGSNASMRENQFEIATYYMMQSPIVGNGTHYVSKVRAMDEGILGAESIWLPLMIEQGILGCVCTALVFILVLYYLYKNRYYSMFLMMIAFVLGKSVSVMGGIGEGFYFIIFGFIIRCYQLGLIQDKDRHEYIQNS